MGFNRPDSAVDLSPDRPLKSFGKCSAVQRRISGRLVELAFAFLFDLAVARESLIPY